MSTDGEPPTKKKKEALDSLKPKHNTTDTKIDWSKKINWKNTVLPNLISSKFKEYLEKNYSQTITGLEFRNHFKSE